MSSIKTNAMRHLDASSNAFDLDLNGNTTFNTSGLVTATKANLTVPTRSDISGSVTWDLANNNQNFRLTGNVTAVAAPSNVVVGQTGSIFIEQDTTGGHTIGGWDSAWTGIGGAAGAPLLSTAGGAVDRLDYVVRSATEIHVVTTWLCIMIYLVIQFS